MAPSVFSLFSPSKAGQRLAPSLSARHTAGWCPWRPTQPRLSTCGSSSPLTGAPAGAGCPEPAANSPVHLCTRPAGHLIHRGHATWCWGDSWAGCRRGRLRPARSKPAGRGLSGPLPCCLPSLEPGGTSQLGQPAREWAPGWGQKAAGGS